MLSKYHRNAILTGYVDAYCLVCESHLRSEDDIKGHISKPIHTKNLESTAFLEKFKDDCVRKVKKGYYCEFCNLLLTTAAKVGLHVTEEKHTNNKGTQLLKRFGNNIVAYHNIVINEKAWNGLIDDTCIICNTEFDNENIHKTEPTHILNLVQNKIEFCDFFEAKQCIYRKIDDSSYQCLTCNMVLGINTIPVHFSEAEHKKLYHRCRQEGIESEFENGQETNKATFQNNVPVLSKEEVKNVAKATNNKPESPMKKQDQTKKPSTPVETQSKFEMPNIKTKRPKLEKVTEDLDEAIAKALGAKDYVCQDDQGKKWCLLCDWTMDSLIIHHHVNGKHHQTMLKMHKERLQKKKKALEAQEINDEYEYDEPIASESLEEQQNREKILDAVSDFQKNEINISFERYSAYCKKCSKSIDFTFTAIETHIEDHKKTPPKKEISKPAPVATNQKDESKKAQSSKSDDSKKAQLHKEDKVEARASSVASNRDNDEELEKFAKKNDLAYNKNDNKVYCKVCDSRVPASMKNMKEHVAGLSHKNKAVKWTEHKNTKVAPVKKRMADFIKKISGIENGFMKDLIINERYCINIYSFFMITCVDRLRCEVCEVYLTMEQVDTHKALAHHERAMRETLVIASIESEFIREVRPDALHCGFCNISFLNEDLDDHLNCTAHRESKTSAAWRLHHYLPEILQEQRARQIGAFLLMKMLSEGNPF